LAFLDSDDLWASTKLEKLIRSFTPRDGWVFEPLLRLEIAMSMPTVMASRELVDEIGGFDEQLRYG
jgi:hypothetical protein